MPLLTSRFSHTFIQRSAPPPNTRCGLLCAKMPPFCAACGKDLEVGHLEVARFCPSCGLEAYGGAGEPVTTDEHADEAGNARSLAVYAAPTIDDADNAEMAVAVVAQPAVVVGQPVAVAVVGEDQDEDSHLEPWGARRMVGATLIVLSVAILPILPVSIPSLMLGGALLDAEAVNIRRHAQCVALSAGLFFAISVLFAVLFFTTLAEASCAAAYTRTDWCVATRHTGCGVDQYHTVGHTSVRKMCDQCQGAPQTSTCGPDVRCTAPNWMDCPEYDRSFENFCGLCDFFHSTLAVLLLCSAILVEMPIMVLAIVVALKDGETTIAPAEVEMSNPADIQADE